MSPHKRKVSTCNKVICSLSLSWFYFNGNFLCHARCPFFPFSSHPTTESRTKRMKTTFFLGQHKLRCVFSIYPKHSTLAAARLFFLPISFSSLWELEETLTTYAQQSSDCDWVQSGLQRALQPLPPPPPFIRSRFVHSFTKGRSVRWFSLQGNHIY